MIRVDPALARNAARQRFATAVSAIRGLQTDQASEIVREAVREARELLSHGFDAEALEAEIADIQEGKLSSCR